MTYELSAASDGLLEYSLISTAATISPREFLSIPSGVAERKGKVFETNVWERQKIAFNF